MAELPKIKIGREVYFLDARLNEIRNIKNPQDREKLEGSPEFYLKEFGLSEITKTESNIKKEGA